MKKLAITLSRVALVVSILAFAACQPRPNRPNPDETMTQGLGPGGHAGGLSFGTVEDDDDLFYNGSGSGLEPRGSDDMYDPANQIRGELESVYFDFDRATISSGERRKAEAAADYLRNNPERRLLIEGHCDWRGTTEYNLGLGDRRATSVKDFIVSLGIDRSRIETLSKGDLEAAQGGSEAEMRDDRRAEFVVIRR